MLMKWFLFNQVWWETQLNSTIWNQFEWPWPLLKVTQLWENWDLCKYSVVKWSEVAWTFAMTDYVREMTANKSQKYFKIELFEHLLFLCRIITCVIKCLHHVSKVVHSFREQLSAVSHWTVEWQNPWSSFLFMFSGLLLCTSLLSDDQRRKNKAVCMSFSALN